MWLDNDFTVVLASATVVIILQYTNVSNQCFIMQTYERLCQL